MGDRQDVPDVFKRALIALNRKGQSVQDRKDFHVSQRRRKKDRISFLKRKIDEKNLSPINSPIPQTDIQSKNVDPTMPKLAQINNRIKQLAEWKIQKQKQRQLDKSNAKPIFKVCHVSSDAISDIESANNLIKGKPINLASKKSQFAPAGIKPLKFNSPKNKPPNFKFSAKDKGHVTNTDNEKQNNNANIYSKRNAQNHKKGVSESNSAQKTNISKIQNHQEMNVLDRPGLLNSKKTTPRNYKKVVSFRKIVTGASPSPPKCKANFRKTPKKSKYPIELNRIELPVLTVDSQTSSESTSSIESNALASLSSISSDYPIDYSSNESVNDGSTSGNILKPKDSSFPVYVSPFVTMTRGKGSSRKEYQIRHSQKALSPKETQYVEILGAHTNPKSGAEYFSKKLNEEIDKIQGVCKEWQEYLAQTDLSEESRSSINVVLGQSQLLLSKKFKQFQDLIDQCRTENYVEKIITCEDLHGFWDMIYIQVKDLDRRFNNLQTLKNNNWEECIPLKTAIVKKTQGRPRKVDGKSKIKDMLMAARKKKKEKCTNEKLSDGVSSKLNTPQPSRTPLSRKKSLRVSYLSSDSKKRSSLSPGLTMMKITQSIRQGNGLTPAKSILKSQSTRSTGKKSVIFLDDIEESRNKCKTKLFEGDKENVENYIPGPITPRRSARISKKCVS